MTVIAMPSLLTNIQQLEAELHHPGMRCSRQRLEQLLHPAFHEVGRSGRPYSRTTVIDFLTAQVAPPAVEPTNHAIHLLAEGCALLTYQSVRRCADGSLADAALRSSVWLRMPEGWQLFYHQGTPMAAGLPV